MRQKGGHWGHWRVWWRQTKLPEVSAGQRALKYGMGGLKHPGSTCSLDAKSGLIFTLFTLKNIMGGVPNHLSGK